MVKRREIEEYVVKMIAECFATCVLILLGECGIANYKFARQTSHSTLPISLAFGAGLYAALMIAGSISEAHINPAVSISLMTIQKIKPLECIFYIIGQISGAFLGAFFVYIVYWNQFNEFDGGIRQMTGPNGTADIFFTMPADGVPKWNTFVDQLISTAILMICLMSISHKLNRMISESAKPFAFVLIIVGLTSGFSVNAGAALNPARDLGPRLFGSFIYGWNNVFHVHRYFFYIPIIGPIVGAIVGVWIYEGYDWILSNYHHSNNQQQTHSDKNNRKDIQNKNETSFELQQKN